MAIQNEPTRIQIPFADSGTKNVIPDTNPTPSASQAASWTDGFPTQCSLPLASGGIPPGAGRLQRRLQHHVAVHPFRAGRRRLDVGCDRGLCGEQGRAWL